MPLEFALGVLIENDRSIPLGRRGYRLLLCMRELLSFSMPDPRPTHDDMHAACSFQSRVTTISVSIRGAWHGIERNQKIEVVFLRWRQRTT